MKTRVNNLLNILLWSVYWLIVIWGPHLFPFHIGPVALYPLRVISIIWLLCVPFIAKFKRAFTYIENKKVSNLMLLFLAVGVITMLWAPDKTAALTYLIIYITSIIVFFMTASFIVDEESLSCASIGIIINALIMMSLAIIESRTGKYIFETDKDSLFYVYNMFGTFRPKAAFHNVNNLAVFFAIVMPLSIMVLKDSMFNRILKIILVGLLSYGMVLTDSRSGFLCILLSVFLILYFDNKLSNVRLRVVLFVLFVSCVSLIIKYHDYIWLLVFPKDISDEARLPIWQGFLRVAENNVFLGGGMGNSSALNQMVNHNEIPPHNYLLELLVEFGIVGLTAFLLWIKKCLPKGQDKYSNYLKICFIVMLICSITPSSMIEMYYMWAIWGISLSYNNYTKITV